MKLKSTVIKNYRGIKDETLVSFQDFNCIVGKNDVGKSTLLKAIDAFLNENNPNIEDKNVYSDSNFIEINLIFDCHMHSISAHYISVHQKFINKQQPC